MRLIAQGVGVEHRGRKVLCGIDLEVLVPETAEAGEFVVVCSKNADAGLALLRVLAGLQAPQSGSVRYLGRNVYEAGQSLKQNLGFVPEGDLVPGSLAVERALGYAAELRLRAQEPEIRAERVEEVMRNFGLGEFAKTRVNRLDAGSFFRVKLAVEQLGGARIVMVDGLGGNISEPARIVFFESLRGMCKTGGVSVVCVLGSVEELASEYCDAVYTLTNGSLMTFIGDEAVMSQC